MPAWVAAVTASLFRDQATAELFAGIGGGVPILDVGIQQAAVDAGVPSRHLETLEQQIAMMAAHDATFLASLDAPDDHVAEEAAATAQMLQACYDLDAEGIAAVTTQSRGDELDRALLDDRNAAWVQVLDPELAEGGVVVAVGVGHMFGPSGLIQHLEDQGYAVTALRGAPSGFVPPAQPEPAEQAAAPAIDPAVVAKWQDALAPDMAAQHCAPGTPVATCVLQDPAACQARIERDVRMCIDQHAEDLPVEGDPDPALLAAVGACAGATPLLEALILDTFPDTPPCPQIRLMMTAAMDEAM